MNSFRHLLINQLMSSEDWTGKPSDWSDIRVNCPKKSIALYAGVKSDYSQYDNLGFTATCTGGYNVFIDGTQYGSTYASGSQCNITWSISGITTGDDITTPSALKAHKIWIEPATAGNSITAFHCAKAGSASGVEHQGVLWVHFNLSNFIDINSLLRTGTTDNIQCKAITAKNNNIKVNNILECCRYAENLEYVAQLTGDGISQYDISTTFYQCYKIKQISLKNMLITQAGTAFYKCYELEEIITSNVLLQPTNDTLASAYGSCYKLKSPLPTTYTTSLTSMNGYFTYATGLDDIVLDVSSATNLGIIGCFGSTGRFMSGFKGLRVSSSAPFNATSPQINVSYTGMDRAALVQLFNDLPTVSGGQVINITGTTGSESLTVDDVMIAVNKGWTVAGGPQPIPDWQVGDRLDGKATFVGYFDSVNPDDSSTQRYAFFALDGNYRAGKTGLTEYGITFNNLLPTHDYNTSFIGQHLSEITESATYSMSVVKTLGINSYPAFKAADNISVSFNGTTYTAVVPNLVEVKAIWDNRATIDSVDPSGVRTLATWGMWDGESSYDRVISTTIRNSQGAFQYNSGGNFAENHFYAQFGFVPIIEIPVPAGHGN